MTVWYCLKVSVDKSKLEEPMERLRAELQAIEDGNGTVKGIRQDITDGTWLIYYTKEE